MYYIALRKRILGYLSIVVYRLILDLNYVKIISPIYEYSGFTNLATKDSFIMSYIILLLSIPFVIKLYDDKRIFFANVMVLLYLTCFVPGTSLMAFIPMNIHFFVLYLSYWFFLLSSLFLIHPIKLPVLSERGRVFLLYLILILLALSVLYVSGKYAEFRFHFSLENEYVLRMEERSWDLPLVFGYLLPTAGNILPVFLVYFLAKKSKWLVLLLAIIIFLNFSIGGHKSVIIKLFLCFLGYWFYSEKRITLYVWFLVLLSCISLSEWMLNGSFVICSLLIRRVLYVPAYLNYLYYDYFSTHEVDFFRQSFLRHLGIDSPYNVPIPRLIGDVYYNAPELNANNGLFSDAYLNMGVIGVLLFPFILAFVVSFISSASKGIDMKLLILPIIAVVGEFSGGTLTSGLLTGGILVLILVLFLFPKENLKCR